MVSEKMKLIAAVFLITWLSGWANADTSVQTDCSKALPLKANAMAVPAASTERLKIALVPFKMEGLKPLPEFLAKMEKSVDEAAKNGAGLVVFPELSMSDLVEAAEKTAPLLEQMKKVAKEQTPKIIEELKVMAMKHQIAILGGSVPRLIGKEIRNTAVFVLASGQEYFQEKLFLTPDEKTWAWSPGTELKIIPAPWGKTVILICYDSEFAEVSQKLSALAPELILVPSMTDSQAGFRRVRWTSQARAVEHKAYVAHVGTVGEADPSWPNYGQASVLTPSEKDFPGVLAEGEANSAKIVYADLDFKKLREARQKGGIYPACEAQARKKTISVKVQK
jgi:predicted amidohydrolase